MRVMRSMSCGLCTEKWFSLRFHTLAGSVSPFLLACILSLWTHFVGIVWVHYTKLIIYSFIYFACGFLRLSCPNLVPILVFLRSFIQRRVEKVQRHSREPGEGFTDWFFCAADETVSVDLVVVVVAVPSAALNLAEKRTQRWRVLLVYNRIGYLTRRILFIII